MLCLRDISSDRRYASRDALVRPFADIIIHHRDDESSWSARRAPQIQWQKQQTGDSLANDPSRAKTALTDAKIHERAIEEVFETRARERSIYQEAETLKSKLIWRPRDQVEDVVEDVDELREIGSLSWEIRWRWNTRVHRRGSDGEARGSEIGRDGEKGEG